VVTRSAQTEIAGIDEDGTLRVRLMASPAGDPAANKELIDFMAARLGVDASRIEIVAGANDRDKIVTIEGVTSEDVEAKLINS
jgi:uncharacterized protein YggU (UPF0235/DUF167 family)